MKCIIVNKDENEDNNIDDNTTDWLYYLYRYNICIMCFNLIKDYCQKK